MTLRSRLDADTQRSDAELVRGALARADGAFDTLVHRHRPAVEAICERVLGTREAAADATQEATLLAYLNLERLERPASFGAWLTGIALNGCRRAIRTSIAQRARVTSISQEVNASAPDPADLVQAAHAAARVRDAVSALPSGQREAVLLFYFAGLTQAEVAAELGTAVGAIKTRLHKARSQLKTRLDGLEVQTMAEQQSTPAAGDAVMMVKSVARYPATEEGGVARHVVCLEEVRGDRRLKIWIGEFEATGIALRLEGADLPRPDTYRFAQRLLEASGGIVKEVRINRLADGVFYASTLVEGGHEPAIVDARPSDALNVALLAGCPIVVSPQVVAAADDCDEPDDAKLPDADTTQLAASARMRYGHLKRHPAPEPTNW